MLKKLTSLFRFTSLLKPMIYWVVFSLLYGAGAIWSLTLSTEWSGLITCLFWALYGVALYFICGLCWGKKRGTLSIQIVAEVFALSLVLALVAMYVLSPLALTASPVLYILGALIGLVFLFFAIPSLILIFRALYEGKTGFKEQIDAVLLAWKKNFWRILNVWLIFVLVLYFWDSFIGGPLYSSSGLNPAALMSSLILLRQPGLSAEMMVLMGASGEGIGELVVLLAICALLEIFFECNMIVWLGDAAAKTWNEESAQPSKPKKSMLDKPVAKGNKRS